MAVATFGNNIVGAFTGGVPVNAIYTGNNIKVWPVEEPEPSFYYVSWRKAPNSTFSYMDFGYFILDSVQYSVNSFLSGYFSGFGGVIDERAFYQNFHLSSVTSSDDMYALIRFETNAKETSSYALAQTKTLSSVYFSNCRRIGNGTFQGCTRLITASFPECTYVARNAFRNTHLFSIYLPKATYIGESAFANCTALSSVRLPACTYVSDWAFASCNALSIVSLPKCSYIGDHVFSGTWRINTLSLPECKYIGVQAFSGDTGNPLRLVYLPKCETIAFGAFMNRNDISTVILPKCKLVDEQAFLNCWVQDLSIPEVEYIGANAFLDCNISNFWGGFERRMDIPKCSFIGTAAFSGAAKFTVLNAPTCKSIGKWAFINGWMTSMDITACEYIGHYAFSNCTGLKEVILPNCSSFGDGAFNNCSNLSILVLGYSGVCGTGSARPIGGTAIAAGSGSIYVPSSLVSAYKADSGWSYYSSVIYPIPS